MNFWSISDQFSLSLCVNFLFVGFFGIYTNIANPQLTAPNYISLHTQTLT